MKFKLTMIGLLLIPTIVFIQSPNANARGEHGGGGGGPAAAAPAAAPAAVRMAAPPPQRSFAPPPQQRSYAPPPQERSFAPPPQQRSYAPPPQERSYAPPQQRSYAQQSQRSFGQERSFAPQAQPQRSQRAERAFSPASQQNALSRVNKNYSSSPSAQTARERNVTGNNSSSHQMMSRHMQGPSSATNLTSGKHSSQSQLGANKANENMGSKIGGQLASMVGFKDVRGTIAKPSSFASPRHVAAPSPGMNPRFSANKPGRLSYRSGAGNIPRAGRVGVGRAGVFDPGGYVRTPGNGTRGLDRNYMRQQLSSQRYYNQNFNNNNRLRNSNYRSWQGGWNPGSAYAGNLGYYPGYSWNGTNYPFSYYGLNGYCPTPWLFMLGSGSFWQPGYGYSQSLPYGYDQPISIAVDEVVPSYDSYGNVIGYRDETFYYNAFWDANTQAYGYYDYRGVYHWTTFPWLNTWSG